VVQGSGSFQKTGTFEDFGKPCSSWLGPGGPGGPR